MKDSTAIMIGVGIGLAVSAIGIGYYLSYRKKKIAQEKEEKLERNTSELLQKKEHYEQLDASEIVEWFKNNTVLNCEVSCVVAKPMEKVLSGLGCKNDMELYGNNALIQMIYDSENKKAIKIRLITYESIETNLETQIDDSNGFMVVTL